MDAEQPTGHDVNPEPPGAAAGDNAGDNAVPERKPSKVAIVIAMAAVAIAILIVMLAPGADNGGAPPAGSPKGNLTGSPNSAADDAVADAKVAGKAAPLDFTLKDMNGVDVKLAAFKGKPIVMNFWATWCGTCRAEIPSLVELQKQYGDEGQDVVILGIS